jgi:hypothetical protein
MTEIDLDRHFDIGPPDVPDSACLAGVLLPVKEEWDWSDKVRHVR